MSSRHLCHLTLLVGLTLGAVAAPRERPAAWATPVIDSSMDNLFRVSADLYRSEQPTAKNIADLQVLGIGTILDLRHYHTDSRTLARAGFILREQRMNAGKITVDDLVAALRQFRDAPKPVLVHCWHGSDRTGAVVAAYRIVFENWTAEAALDELRHGGYGYHEHWFPDIVTLFEHLDVENLRQRVLE